MNNWRLLLVLGSVLTLVVITRACGGSVRGTAESHVEKGNRLAKQGRHEDAIKEYTTAIEKDPDSSVAHYNRGIAFQRLDNPKRAVVDYTMAIELNQKAALAYYHRGLAYTQLRKNDEAIADFEKFIALGNSQEFIESYMAGLNHEFARELIWREYPTDQRRRYFEQYWRKAAKYIKELRTKRGS